jgi:hypothetical protein
MRGFSLFSVSQHLKIRGRIFVECEDQSCFKVQVVPVFRYVIRCVRVTQVEHHYEQDSR